MLKWRFQSRDEDLVPLTINCWPSASGSESYVNIEYESSVDYDLQAVVIAIPVPNIGHAPTVNQVGLLGCNLLGMSPLSNPQSANIEGSRAASRGQAACLCHVLSPHGNHASVDEANSCLCAAQWRQQLSQHCSGAGAWWG